METLVIAFYCVADDLFKSMHIREDQQVQMNNAEVVTVAWTAAYFFGGNWESAREFLKEERYIPRMLSKSRFCRRLHEIPESFWQQLAGFFSRARQGLESSNKFIVDSFPIAVCDNIRAKRRHLLKEERYRGKCASKRRYFIGIKVHVLMTLDYRPVEWLFTPGCESDIRAFRRLNLNIAEGSSIYGDAAYTDYEEEDLLGEAEGTKLYAQRKCNSKRKRPGWLEFLITLMRKKIETGFSMITSRFPKSIHAVTNEGFLLKCASFITAFACWRAFDL